MAKSPIKRDDLVARLDAAVEGCIKKRTALRLAERRMVKAREQLAEFDAQAKLVPAPAHRP